MNARTPWLRGVALAAIAAFGLTACGDNVTNVPPQPEPAITITVTPATLSLKVGQSQQVVATVSNSDNKSVTFSSSNSSVATVDGSGLVTAVAEGTATIIATAAADPSVQAGVGVTVAPQVIPGGGDTASIVINSITQYVTNEPVDPNDIYGQIDISLAVDRADADKLEVLLNDEPVSSCTQTFGATGAITVDGLSIRMVGAQAEVVCSINTGSFDVVDGYGVPNYANGEYTIKAQLSKDGEVVDAASRAGLTFNNDDFIATTITSERDAINENTGLVWNGGDVTVTGIPVSYSGGDMAIARVTFNPDDGDAITDEDGSDGFSATFDATDAADGIGDVTDSSWQVYVTSVTEGGQQGENDWTEAIRLDTEAPDAGTLDLVTPSSNAWINGDYAFADGKDAEDDAGVDNVTVQFFYMDAADVDAGTTVEQAMQIADEGTAVEAGSEIPASDVNTTYMAAAVVMDALENTSYVLLITPNTLLDNAFGVDLVAPTVKIESGPKDMSGFDTSPLANWVFSSTDDISGFDGMQYHVTVVRHFPSLSASAGCVVGSYSSSKGCQYVTNAGTVAGPAADGYYVLNVFSQDQAGNMSATLSRVTLLDTSVPTLSNIAIPATLTGGASTTFTALGGDNIDVASAQARLVFNGATPTTGLDELWFGPGSDYGTYGYDTFTTSVSLNEAIPFIRALYWVDAGNAYAAANMHAVTDVRYLVEDMVGNATTQSQAFSTVPASDGVDALDATNTFAVAIPSAAQNVCNDDGDCGTTPTTRTITAYANGETGTFDNPFSKVYFYYWDGAEYHLIGTASSVSTSDDGTTRTWKYNATFDAAGLDTQAGVPVFAVGVDNNGDALMSNPNSNLTIVAGS